jgi:hypothetical protein
MKTLTRFSRVYLILAMKVFAVVCATSLVAPFLWAQTAIGQPSVSSWDFGPTLVGCTSPEKNIALWNKGDVQLVMYTISINGPFALPINRCAKGVRPGTHCNVSVTYSPDSLVTDTGTLTFNDNASNSPQTVALSGHAATIVPTASTTLGRRRVVYYGQTASFQGEVVSLGGCSVPNGELMTFHNGSGFVYCSGPIVAGVANCSAQILLPYIPGGFYTVRAAYPGDTHFEPSESSNYTGGLTVLRWPSTTTVTASPSPTNVGQLVTITATVSSASSYLPTGIVYFYVGGKFWRQASLTSGIAQTIYVFPTAGNWAITVNYFGDGGTAKSSGSLTQVVNP